MYFPRLPNTKANKYKKSAISWSGLDRRELIDDSKLAESLNLSTKCHPLLSPRPPRETVYTLSKGHALFASSQLAWVDGTDFKYNNLIKGTVTASAKSIVEISKRIVVFPDKVSYDTVDGTFAAFGSGNWYNPAGPEPGSVPDIQYACMLDNRIWGVDNKDNICCTALGEYNDWTTFSSPSEATDAWSVDTGTNGDFTGIVAYKGYNLAFKVDGVWKRYGSIPENFEFRHFSKLGCVNHKSIKEVNNILFWLSKEGVVAYTGGVPEVISEELNDTYVSAVAGGDDRRYYLSLYDGNEYKLYVYDTWKSEWYQEDDLNVVDFAYFDGSLFALASDNKIYKFNSGTEMVSWVAVTKEYSENVSNKKGHSDLFFRVDLEANSSLKVYVKTDNGLFELVKDYSATDLTTFKVPLQIKRADRFQIKVEGLGEGKIHAIERKFYYGSEY